ncbi:hypothetical protein ACFYQT_39730 [Streptomyces tibetensis]|uniref:Uncharacterized protein n=1 Tax=Streptomyces tibetensis TaxID=2382123 RepID=A0ABW6N8A4_9ACTN
MPRTSSPRTTPAKKATAAKKTTTRAPRKTTTPATRKLSLVKPRKDLPSRPRHFMTDIQGYATLAARLAGIPTPSIRDWHDHHDGTATRTLTDGSHLHYTLETRTLRWQALCPMGATHEYVLDTPSTACAVRVHADRCTETHATFTHIPRLTRDELTALGVHTGPTWARPDLLGDAITETIPVPDEALTRATASAADTQSLSRDDIADGLKARADQDAAREHPGHD